LALIGFSIACFSVCSVAARADRAIPPDSGKFIVILQEAELGGETFTIDANGNFDSKVELTLVGNKIKLHNLTRMKDGRIVSLASEAEGHGKFQMTASGPTGKLTVNDKPFKDQKLAPHPYPFGNFTPHLYAALIAGYDLKAGGPQKFDLIDVDGVGPAGLPTVVATLSPLGAQTRQVDGKPLTVTRYSLIIPGALGNIDTELVCDADGRILLWNVPGQKLAEVRDGYQDLMKLETPADPTLSQPTFKVKVEHNVRIAMRDGIHLAADVYRPDAPGTFPVILQRTPYNRANAVEATSYAKRGYVFVAQDVRGRFDSEGEWHPFVMEARDGYDSVEWCAKQPWSTGNVGMIGASYLGFVQWAAAREGNPHLKCLIPIVSPPDPFYNVPYAFGALFLFPDLWWANVVPDHKTFNLQAPGSALKNLKAYETLPLNRIDKAVLGRTIPFFQEWLRHASDDSYWDRVDFNGRMKQMGPIPALHVSGWFDGDGIGTKLNYADMVASGHANQKLIYGPWTHAVNTTSKVGPLDFGPQALRDLDTLYLRWFDHWLKGVDNGIDREPPVDAFLMGENRWHTYSAWPPKEAQQQRWYFHSGGHSNADRSDGTLSLAPQAPHEPADRYVYNPASPYIPPALKAASKTGKNDDAILALPARDPGLLQYTTATLASDLVVAGPISVHLVAASSARDTDWWATLEDVYPDGKMLPYCQGIIRARFRRSGSKPTLLTPGRPESYEIDLWALGMVFKKGHRLRVEVTSSCFPIYDRNLNTGDDIATGTRMVTARQTVYHTADRASYLVLPVLPQGE
jgi:putative CocE/NonD family hydrolase